jgi:hypothetical protein
MLAELVGDGRIKLAVAIEVSQCQALWEGVRRHRIGDVGTSKRAVSFARKDAHGEIGFAIIAQIRRNDGLSVVYPIAGADAEGAVAVAQEYLHDLTGQTLILRNG